MNEQERKKSILEVIAEQDYTVEEMVDSICHILVGYAIAVMPEDAISLILQYGLHGTQEQNNWEITVTKPLNDIPDEYNEDELSLAPDAIPHIPTKH